MKRFFVLLCFAALMLSGCNAQPRTEGEFRTWAMDRYRKADGHEPDALQLKVVDKFVKVAAATEKQSGHRMDDDQTVMLFTDTAGEVVLDPKNH